MGYVQYPQMKISTTDPFNGFTWNENMWHYMFTWLHHYAKPKKIQIFTSVIQAIGYGLMGVFEPIPFYAITFMPMLVMEYGLFAVAPTLDMPAIPWEVWIFGEDILDNYNMHERYHNLPDELQDDDFNAHDFAGEDRPD